MIKRAVIIILALALFCGNITVATMAATSPGYKHLDNAEDIVSITGFTKMQHAYHQVIAVAIEYREDVVLPLEGNEAFSMVDYASLTLRDEDERRASNQGVVAAVYTNNSATLRSDRSSIEGNYIVVEFEPTNSVVYDDETDTYLPNHVAGIATWRQIGHSTDWRRRDFSELHITQLVDIKNGKGEVVASAGKLPDLDFEQLVNFELDEFITTTMPSPHGDYDMNFSYYLPEGFSHNKQYPMILDVSGGGGRLDYSHRDELGHPYSIGGNISRDRGAVAWLSCEEDVIVLSPQIWSNTPADWKATTENAIEDTAYLIDYFIEHFSVDPDRVYAIGSSFGTMHLSGLLRNHANKIAAYIQCNGHFEGAQTKFIPEYDSVFRGLTAEDIWGLGEDVRLDRDQYHAEAKEALQGVIDHRVPVYIWHGVNDQTAPVTRGLSTYEILRELYEEEGVPQEEIDMLVQIELIEDEEFYSHGIIILHSASKIAVSHPELLAWTLAQKRSQDTVLAMTTTAHNVKAGQTFKLETTFKEEQESNTAILNYTWDGDLFKFAYFYKADGVTLLDHQYGDGWAKITLMAPDYDLEALGVLDLTAKEDAPLVRGWETVKLDIEYVLRDENGDKSIENAATSARFTTVGNGPNPEPYLPGDTNDDGVVDIMDLSNMIDWFGYTSQNQSDWDDWYTFFDFNNDGEIDISDIAHVARLI